MSNLQQLQRRALGALAFMSTIGLSSLAYAQTTSGTTPTTVANGLGAQVNTMAGEAMNTGGTIFGAACYLAAAVCFALGVWALWSSRQPQNRESGYIGRGIAGLVLCGLFVVGGSWINKAALTAGGGSGTIVDGTSSGMVTFK